MSLLKIQGHAVDISLTKIPTKSLGDESRDTDKSYKSISLAMLDLDGSALL